MSSLVRLLCVGALYALVSVGLVGCSAFAESRRPDGQAMASHHGPAQIAEGHHAHHGGMAEQGGSSGDDEACGDCAQSVLVRMSAAPQPVLADMPCVVFFRPAGTPPASLLVLMDKDLWPPGAAPPVRPPALLQQKTSFLI